MLRAVSPPQHGDRIRANVNSKIRATDERTNRRTAGPAAAPRNRRKRCGTQMWAGRIDHNDVMFAAPHRLPSSDGTTVRIGSGTVTDHTNSGSTTRRAPSPAPTAPASRPECHGLALRGVRSDVAKRPRGQRGGRRLSLPQPAMWCSKLRNDEQQSCATSTTILLQPPSTSERSENPRTTEMPRTAPNHPSRQNPGHRHDGRERQTRHGQLTAEPTESDVHPKGIGGEETTAHPDSPEARFATRGRRRRVRVRRPCCLPRTQP